FASGRLDLFAGERRMWSQVVDRSDQDAFAVISEDHRRFAVVGLKDLWIDRVDGSSELVRLAGHRAPTIDASFDASGTRLVSTSQDGGALVWDLADRRVAHRLVSAARYLAGAVFDPTGLLIVTLDGSGSLQVFAADSGELVGQIPGSQKFPKGL